MATTKPRINLTTPIEISRALERLASRDEISVSAKTLELIRLALDLEEDDILQEVVEKRDRRNVKYIPHTTAWR
jgi:hypothetical protein